MDKITFTNGQQPALNDTNLNLLQNNIEKAINEINDTNNETKKWKEKNINLSYNETITIEGLKTANEAIVYFNDSGTLTDIYYPKNISNTWVSTYVKTSAGGDGRCSVKIYFETGVVQNGAQGYIDLGISKILWR